MQNISALLYPLVLLVFAVPRELMISPSQLAQFSFENLLSSQIVDGKGYVPRLLQCEANHKLVEDAILIWAEGIRLH